MNDIYPTRCWFSSRTYGRGGAGRFLRRPDEDAETKRQRRKGDPCRKEEQVRAGNKRNPSSVSIAADPLISSISSVIAVFCVSWLFEKKHFASKCLQGRGWGGGARTHHFQPRVSIFKRPDDGWWLLGARQVQVGKSEQTAEEAVRLIDRFRKCSINNVSAN